VTVASGTSTSHLVFYRQRTGVPVARLDPAQNYLGLARRGHVVGQSNNTYTVAVTSAGTTGTLDYTVTGQYIGKIDIQAPGTTVVVTISMVGTAPPVGLPKGARVITSLPSRALSGAS
ncbi:MAG: hypothetical protein JO368_09120, partial [Acidimicrobiales bacterium]|nr:hypothetical protein [Acidimicrobiales bacterium]